MDCTESFKISKSKPLLRVLETCCGTLNIASSGSIIELSYFNGTRLLTVCAVGRI